MKTLTKTYCEDSYADSIVKKLKEKGVEVKTRPTMSNGFHATEVTAVAYGRKQVEIAVEIMWQ